uniref:Leucine hydroxylase n=2 Tax=Streptomyces TaxID=1883 RepID=A0A0E3URV8_STRM4|nr:leucine hydroxylase [Streptomyces muensis]
MQLTADQVEKYKSDGYVLLEGAFSPEEVHVMRQALKKDQEVQGPHRILEEDGRTVRALYASHTRQSVFDQLSRSDRLLGPATQLLECDLYIHQFKINTKRAFGGDSWAWHQDFIVWRDTDGLPAPRAVNVGVFLSDVTEFNGPVVFLSGSHQRGTVERKARETSRSDQHVDPDDYSMTPAELSQMVEKHPMVSPKAASGSVMLFHPEIIHGSAPNISPFARDLLIITYNDVANAPKPAGEPRPEYVIGRDTTPLVSRSGPLHEAAESRLA